MTDSAKVSTGQLLLGRQIRRIRDEAGIRLTDLAASSGLSVAYLSNIEHGARLPSLEALIGIAEGLGTTVTDVLQGLYPFDTNVRPRKPVASVSDGRSVQS